MDKKNICVVVMGDIGRSPRMSYHSESFAEHGHKVDVICYRETPPKPSLNAQPLVSFHYLVPYPSLKLPRLVNYVLKTLWQAITLLFVFLIIRKPSTILVQNPPAVPSLLVCWFFSWIVGARYIIDWHNYAHSIMALNVGKKNILVCITKKIEQFVGRRASDNICVTKEMKKDLLQHWNVNATTLYDRPSETFKPISNKEKHKLFMKLHTKYSELGSNMNEETVITKFTDGEIALKADRPGIIISSTSWTEDEDFSVLLAALQRYEEHIINGNQKNLPDLICVITGKGPLKDYYLKKIKELELEHIKIITPWLEADDYPKMLASADLGVCLHTSSSGLDLPMKVVDMFGCEIPVCAYNFRCLNELVKHNENSFIFNDSDELARQIQTWFEEFPNNKQQQQLQGKFINELRAFRKLSWRENWDTTALNIFEK